MAAKRYPLEILIAAIDDATKPLTRLHKQLEGLNKPVRKLQKSFSKLARSSGLVKLQRSLMKVRQAVRGVGAGVRTAMFRMAAFTAGVGAAAAGIGFFVKRAGEMEQVQVQFKTLLGGAKQSQEMIAKLIDFAVKTPFELRGIFSQAQVLTAMTVTAKEMIPTMRMLGDISSAFPINMQNLVDAYGKVKAGGFLTGIELKSFRRGGIPVLKLIADQYGATIADVKKAMAAGQITFKVFQGALKTLVQKGGPAYNMMAEQAKTLFGLWSNFVDQVDRTSMAIGARLLPILKPWLSWMIDFLDVNRELISQKIGDFFVNMAERIPFAVAAVKRAFAEWRPKLVEVWDWLKKVHENVGLVKVALVALGAYIFGPFLLAMGALANAVLGFSAALATSPLGLFLIGITGMSIAVKALVDDWRILWSTMKEFFAWVLKVPKKIFEGIFKITGTMGDSFGKGAGIGGRHFSGKIRDVVDKATVPDIPKTIVRDASVKVLFENAPKGTRVTPGKDSDLPLDLDIGFQLNPMGGLP